MRLPLRRETEVVKGSCVFTRASSLPSESRHKWSFPKEAKDALPSGGSRQRLSFPKDVQKQVQNEEGRPSFGRKKKDALSQGSARGEASLRKRQRFPKEATFFWTSFGKLHLWRLSERSFTSGGFLRKATTLALAEGREEASPLALPSEREHALTLCCALLCKAYRSWRWWRSSVHTVCVYSVCFLRKAPEVKPRERKYVYTLYLALLRERNYTVLLLLLVHPQKRAKHNSERQLRDTSALNHPNQRCDVFLYRRPDSEGSA